MFFTRIANFLPVWRYTVLVVLQIHDAKVSGISTNLVGICHVLKQMCKAPGTLSGIECLVLPSFENVGKRQYTY
jgi:hypothetical protein